jgi:hypothetical protein
MTAGRAFGLLALGAALLLVITGIGAQGLAVHDHDRVIWIMLAAGAVYAAVVCLLRRSECLLQGAYPRRTLVLILCVAALCRVLLLPAPPVSTDIYRYVWDGRVQAAGINPYRYRPADDAVAFLRDDAIFPNINRAETAVTIYPPAAQGIFRAVTAAGGSVTAMKLTMVMFEALIIGATLLLLRRRGLPDSRIVIYAWHPLPLFEFAGSGHVDAAALGLMVLACVVADLRKPLTAGALLGAATLVKFFPLAILPSLYRRWDWRLPLGVVLLAAVLYAPFLDVGGRVIGFLPGYLQQEGFAGGDGFFLVEALRSLLPLPAGANLAYVAAGLILLAGIALVVIFRPSAGVSMTAALWLLGTFTLLLSPHLAWYFTWVIPLLCVRMSWALLYLTLTAPLLYRLIWEPEPLLLHATLYLPFAAILLIESAIGPHGPTLESPNDARAAPRHAN